jgi:Activator of Hsp90 ATPase homolog 1-like protein
MLHARLRSMQRVDRSIRRRFVPLVVLSLVSACFAPTEADDPLPGPVLDSYVAADESNARWMTSSVLLDTEASVAASWITDPARLRVWFAEVVEFSSPGGGFRIGWPSSGQEWSGKLLELDPAGRLAAEVPNRVDGAPVEIRFSLAPDAGFQRVTVTIGPFGKTMADEAAAIGYREGTNVALLNLRRASAGEAVPTPRMPVIDRTFQARETPREGLEAEIKMKDAGKTPPKDPSGAK